MYACGVLSKLFKGITLRTGLFSLCFLSFCLSSMKRNDIDRISRSGKQRGTAFVIQNYVTQQGACYICEFKRSGESSFKEYQIDLTRENKYRKGRKKNILLETTILLRFVTFPPSLYRLVFIPRFVCIYLRQI